MEEQRFIGTTVGQKERASSGAGDRQEGSTNVETRNSDKRSSLTEPIATRRTVLLALVFALLASSLLVVETDAKRKRGSHSNQSRFVQIDPNHQIPKLDPDVLNPNPCDAAEAALNGFLPQTVTLKKTASYWAKMTVGKGTSDRYCFFPDGEFQISFINTTVRQYVKGPNGRWISIAPALSGRIRVRFAVDSIPPSTYEFSELDVLAVEIYNLPSSLQEPVRTGIDAMFPDTFTFTV